MCYKVHGRSVEERLKITVNEHGQPIGPDDATCNEFISFLGTIARKAHILPLPSELQELDPEKDVDTVILTIVSSDNKKKCRFNLHGRGVSSTQLKQKDIMKKVEEKHAKEVEAIQKDYEDKRQQDRRDIANSLRSFFSQFQQQNPHMSFDLSMFGSLLLDVQIEKDTNPVGLLQLRSSSSTSKIQSRYITKLCNV
ncbi:Ketol-acid reductoisomerase mitochondrial, partial [Bienertia sinuspersici]